MTRIASRLLLTDFSLANQIYADARVQVFVVDTATWRPTTTLATLYQALTGTAEHENPLALDSLGKWLSAVYVDQPVICRISGPTVPNHDTGAIALQSAFRGEWEIGAVYTLGDIVRDGRFGSDTNKLYIATIGHISSGSWTSDLTGGKWLLYVDASTPVDYDDTIVSPATGFFFENEGARIHRLNDRLFLGAAVDNDGSTQGGGIGADWFSAGTGVSAGLNWVHFAATVALTVPSGKVGFAAASRASDVPAGYGSTQASIPFVGIGIMDRTGSGPPYWTSYGAYFEARMEPVSAAIGTVIGIEIDAINFGSVVHQSTPWRRQTLGGATALWLASGGDPANHGRAIAPAQLALGIVNNGETFTAGLVFANDAIEGTDGSSGFGHAVALSTRHLIGWWGVGAGNGEIVNYITSTATVPGPSLQFQNGATLHISVAGNIDFSVSNIASAVNGIGVVPSVTGASPYLETFGNDANVPLKIKPKGAGNLELYAEQMLFYSDVGAQLSGVVSSVTDNTYFSTLEFTDGGPFLYGRGYIVCGFGMVANGVNRLVITNAATGNPASVAAAGTDTNIDIYLDPQGTTGTIRFGVPTATSASAGSASALPGVPASYLIVKDGAGTSLKIPAWNT